MAHVLVLRWWRELTIAALAIVCVFLWQVNRLNRALYTTATESLTLVQSSTAKYVISERSTLAREVKIVERPGKRTTTIIEHRDESRNETREKAETSQRTEEKRAASSLSRYSLGVGYTSEKKYHAAVGARIGDLPLHIEVLGYGDRKEQGYGLGLRIDF